MLIEDNYLLIKVQPSENCHNSILHYILILVILKFG